jgi:hypothetical protein
VDDELVKVVRVQRPAGSSPDDEQDFTQHVLSGVRFAAFLHHPVTETIIPSRIWNPSIHQYYPDSFQDACQELLMCSNANYVQVVKPQPTDRYNFASMLPRVVWLEILSYTHRDCKMSWILYFSHISWWHLLMLFSSRFYRV